MREGRVVPVYEEFTQNRIAQLRMQKNVSARDMSLTLGQNNSYINQIENKKALPSLQGLFYICEYFGITPQQFFDDGNAYPVQLADLVEEDNIYIFGKSSEEVIAHYEKADYVSKDYYKKSPVIREAVDFIIGEQAMKAGHKENLERLYKELLNKDWFMTLLDLEDYIAVKDKMLEDYKDREKWKKMMLVNIAKAGFFSSDRTIREYNRDIWKLK